jgi:threonine/homoserine/homoserine lactone efflux protein
VTVKTSCALLQLALASDRTCVASSFASFTVVALAVVLLPGADTVLVLRTSLRDGSRAGTITALGVVCGPVIWGALAGLGVALVLSRNALVYRGVAIAGGVYLGYLAYRSFVSAYAAWRSAQVDLFESDQGARSRRSASYYLTGLMTNLLNPKIGVFYLSVMPGLFLGQHITAWVGGLLGAIHAVLGLVFLSAVAALSGFTRKRLTRPRVQAVIELVCGACLLSFGGFAVIEATNVVGIMA